jgi:hypothetical protein
LNGDPGMASSKRIYGKITLRRCGVDLSFVILLVGGLAQDDAFVRGEEERGREDLRPDRRSQLAYRELKKIP